MRTDLFQRNPNKTPITDFFGSVRNVELLSDTVELVSLNSTGALKNNQDGGVVKPNTRAQHFYGSQLPIEFIKT